MRTNPTYQGCWQHYQDTPSAPPQIHHPSDSAGLGIHPCLIYSLPCSSQPPHETRRATVSGQQLIALVFILVVPIVTLLVSRRRLQLGGKQGTVAHMHTPTPSSRQQTLLAPRPRSARGPIKLRRARDGAKAAEERRCLRAVAGVLRVFGPLLEREERGGRGRAEDIRRGCKATVALTIGSVSSSVPLGLVFALRGAHLAGMLRRQP